MERSDKKLSQGPVGNARLSYERRFVAVGFFMLGYF